MIFLLISLLIILISCKVINNNDDYFNFILKYLNRNLKNDNYNLKKIYTSTEKYLQKQKIQEDYLKFINDINSNYYYSLNKKKNSLVLNLLSSNTLINNNNCYSYHLFIGNDDNIYLLCINNKYSLLSLYNLTINEKMSKSIINIPVSLSLDYSLPIYLSFSSFDEEQAKIFIFNNQIVYTLYLKINYFIDSFTVSNIKKLIIPISDISTNLRINTNIDNNLIYLSTTLYHGNTYIIYGYSTGVIKVYLMNDKSKDDNISIRTVFNLHKNINKIYQIQGYLFIVTDNRRKINVLSLLGNNNILVNCYNYNDIIDLVFEYKKNLLYILDNNGNIMIKELVLSNSKQYTNICNNIYYLQIPKYIVEKHKKLNKKMKLIMTKDLNTIYVIGFNYLGFINNKFFLENYILYNQNNKINILQDNENFFIKGDMTFLLTNYNKKILIYKIKNINNENIKDNKTFYKESSLYNSIGDSLKDVECNGNIICELLFRSIIKNKYVINTLYILCIIIIFSIIYHYNRNKIDKRKIKTFKEDNYDKKEKNNKLYEMIYNLRKIQNYSYHKKTNKENGYINNSKKNKYLEDYDEEYKEYYGDDDEDYNDNELNENDKEQKSQEFFEKPYHKYDKDIKNIKKKEIIKYIKNFEMSEDDEYNNINNNFEKPILNTIKEREISSQEDSDYGTFNTD